MRISHGNKLRLLYFLSYALGSSWFPYFNVYLNELGMSGSQMGYISSLIPLSMLVFLPLWGVVADRYGRILCYRIAIFATMVATLLFIFFGNTGSAVIICTITYSIFYVPILPLLDSLALDHVEDKEKLDLAHLRLWGSVGAAIGAQFSGIIIDLLSTSAIYFVSLSMVAIALPLAFSLKETNEKALSIRPDFKNVKNLLSIKPLIVLLILIGIISIGQTANWNYLTVYIRDLGGSASLSGTAIIIQGFSEIPFYLLSIIFFRKLGLRNTFVLATFASSVRLFLYSINSKPEYVLLIESLNGVSWTIFWLSSIEYVNNLVPKQWRATGQSLLWVFYYGAGAIIGNIWCGKLYEHLTLQKIFSINGLIIGICAVMAWIAFKIWGKRSGDDSVSGKLLTVKAGNRKSILISNKH